MQNKTSVHRTAAIVAISAFVALGGIVVSRAEPAEGCGRVEGSIVESTRFTPYGARLSHLTDHPVTHAGRAASSSDSRIDDLPLRWMVGDSDRSHYQYFFERELDDRLTRPQFLAAGGVQLDRDMVAGGQAHTAADVVAAVGERAVEVQVGEHQAALVWADPESNGVRPHHVYWSDGTYNYTLVAVRAPERTVELAREFVCGS